MDRLDKLAVAGVVGRIAPKAAVARLVQDLDGQAAIEPIFGEVRFDFGRVAARADRGDGATRAEDHRGDVNAGGKAFRLDATSVGAGRTYVADPAFGEIGERRATLPATRIDADHHPRRRSLTCFLFFFFAAF